MTEYHGVDLGLHVPHSARVTDYFLGGLTNFQADRAAAGWMMAMANMPLPEIVRSRRLSLQGIITRLAQAGAAQFLDLGCGLPVPTVGDLCDTHTLAARAAGERATTTVYVDLDPIVAPFCTAVHRPDAPHRAQFRQADLREADLIPSLVASGLLDPDLPTAVVLGDVLQELTDDEVRALAASLARDLPPGSALALSHPGAIATWTPWLQDHPDETTLPWHPRTLQQTAPLLAGWVTAPSARSARKAERRRSPGWTSTAVRSSNPRNTRPAPVPAKNKED